MKLQEVNNYYKNMSDEALLEHVAENNDTPFKNEDVAKIIRMGNDPSAWSKPMTGEELLAEILKVGEEVERERAAAEKKD